MTTYKTTGGTLYLHDEEEVEVAVIIERIELLHSITLNMKKEERLLRQVVEQCPDIGESVRREAQRVSDAIDGLDKVRAQLLAIDDTYAMKVKP